MEDIIDWFLSAKHIKYSKKCFIDIKYSYKKIKGYEQFVVRKDYLGTIDSQPITTTNIYLNKKNDSNDNENEYNFLLLCR